MTMTRVRRHPKVIRSCVHVSIYIWIHIGSWPVPYLSPTILAKALEYMIYIYIYVHIHTYIYICIYIYIYRQREGLDLNHTFFSEYRPGKPSYPTQWASFTQGGRTTR